MASKHMQDGRFQETVHLTDNMRNELYERRNAYQNHLNNLKEETEDVKDAIQLINNFLNENQCEPMPEEAASPLRSR